MPSFGLCQLAYLESGIRSDRVPLMLETPARGKYRLYDANSSFESRKVLQITKTPAPLFQSHALIAKTRPGDL